jgi:hypothetical protein
MEDQRKLKRALFLEIESLQIQVAELENAEEGNIQIKKVIS